MKTRRESRSKKSPSFSSRKFDQTTCARRLRFDVDDVELLLRSRSPVRRLVAVEVSAGAPTGIWKRLRRDVRAWRRRGHAVPARGRRGLPAPSSPWRAPPWTLVRIVGSPPVASGVGASPARVGVAPLRRSSSAPSWRRRSFPPRCSGSPRSRRPRRTRRAPRLAPAAGTSRPRRRRRRSAASVLSSTAALSLEPRARPNRRRRRWCACSAAGSRRTRRCGARSGPRRSHPRARTPARAPCAAKCPAKATARIAAGGAVRRNTLDLGGDACSRAV